MDASDLLSALGPLAPLYVDPEVIVIMVDAPDRVVIERQNEFVRHVRSIHSFAEVSP